MDESNYKKYRLALKYQRQWLVKNLIIKIKMYDTIFAPISSVGSSAISVLGCQETIVVRY